MKKKIIVSFAALLLLVVSVIGFYSIQAVGDNTPKVEAFVIPPAVIFYLKYPGCNIICEGGPLDAWDECMSNCLMI